MGVSQVAASHASGGMLTVARDANEPLEGLAVAVVGGDDAPVADAAIADAARLVDAARAWADARRPGALPAAAISAR